LEINVLKIMSKIVKNV